MRRASLLLISAFAAVQALATAQEGANLVAIEGHGVRIEARISSGEIKERYLARRGDGA
jgi:hypothetical protein